MRTMILCTVAVLGLAGQAAAQPSNYSASGTAEITATDSSPLASLPNLAMEWITQEMVRQAKAPKDLTALDETITIAIGPELATFAKRKRLADPDVLSAVRLMIVREAGRMLDQDIKARRKALLEDPADLAGQGIEAAVSRREQNAVLEKEARRLLTGKASRLISN